MDKKKCEQENVLRLVKKSRKGVLRVVFSRFGLMALLLILELVLLWMMWRWFNNDFEWFAAVQGIFTVLMFLGSLRTTAVLAALFAVVVAAFFLLGFGALNGITGLTRAGGFAGLLAGAMAWYLCLAGVLSSTFGRPVLPNKSLVG